MATAPDAWLSSAGEPRSGGRQRLTGGCQGGLGGTGSLARVDPDVEVDITPADWARGRDPQLETVVRLALEALAEQPATIPPDPETGPRKTRPPLPPRSVRNSLA